MRLETLQKELSALKSSTSTLAVDMGLGLSSRRETEGKRLEKMVRAQHVLLSRSPSPNGRKLRESRTHQVHLDIGPRLSLSPKRSWSPKSEGAMEADVTARTQRGNSPVTLLEQAAGNEIALERPVPSRAAPRPVNFIPDPQSGHAAKLEADESASKDRGGLQRCLGDSH